MRTATRVAAGMLRITTCFLGAGIWLVCPAYAYESTQTRLTSPSTVAAGSGGIYWSAQPQLGEPFVMMRAPATDPSQAGHVGSVAAQFGPYDADVGRGADGRRAVTWAACERPAVLTSLPYWIPFHVQSGGCRLMELRGTDPAAVGPGPPAGRSDHLPSRWGDRLAFARGVRVYVRDLRGGSLRAVPRPAPVSRRTYPLVLRLRGTQLLGTWVSFTRGLRTEVRVTDLSGPRWRTRVLATGSLRHGEVGKFVSGAGIVDGRALIASSGRTQRRDPFRTRLLSVSVRNGRLLARRALPTRGLVTSSAAARGVVSAIGYGTLALTAGCTTTVPCTLTTVRGGR